MNPFEEIKETPKTLAKATPEAVNELQAHIEKGSTVQIVPKGYKGLIIRKEISPELKQNVDEVTNRLVNLQAIVSQETASAANVVLKAAKGLIKKLEDERKKMDELLNEEKDHNKSIEASIVGQLATLTTIVNKKITDFQVEEERKANERAKELQRQKDEELLAAQKERDRVTNIKNMILKFETSVVNAANGATLATIDTLISQLKNTNLKAETYQEFLSEAQTMYNNSVVKMENRKAELIKYAELEKQNKEQAALLKKQQEEKAEADRKALEEKQAAIVEETKDAELNAVANVQMTHELKTSMNVGAKGVQKRWTFEEETVDIKLLPEEFLTYDKEAIRKAIAAGRHEIPGVKIYQKTINVSR